MHKHNKHESGFGLIETILAVVIVILIVVAGWLVYKRLNHNTASNGTNSNSNSSSTEQKTRDTVTLPGTTTGEQ